MLKITHTLQAILLMGSCILFNPFTGELLLDPIRADTTRSFLILWDVFALSLGILLLVSGKRVEEWFRGSAWVGALLILAMFALYLEFNLIFYAKLKLLRNLQVLVLWLCSAAWFSRWVIRGSPKKNGWKTKASLIIFSLWTLFLVCEIIFTWPGRTHAYARTLANNTWFERYGGPISESGFRDRDLPRDQLEQKEVLLFIGDSYVAGPGIEDIEDRFSNRVDEALGEKYAVLSRGWGGFGTPQEMEILQNTETDPDRVFLCWTPNDILNANDSLEGIFGRRFDYSQAGPLGWLINRSYALNYLYWSFPHNDFPDFLPKLQSLYADTATLHAHFRQIKEFGELAKKRTPPGTPVHLILFPYPRSVASSQFAVDSIQNHFIHQSGWIITDIGNAWENTDGEDLVVNRNDGHPNELANELAAEEILRSLERVGLTRE